VVRAGRQAGFAGRQAGLFSGARGTIVDVVRDAADQVLLGSTLTRETKRRTLPTPGRFPYATGGNHTAAERPIAPEKASILRPPWDTGFSGAFLLRPWFTAGAEAVARSASSSGAR
jgi:hypothetical protein